LSDVPKAEKSIRDGKQLEADIAGVPREIEETSAACERLVAELGVAEANRRIVGAGPNDSSRARFAEIGALRGEIEVLRAARDSMIDARLDSHGEIAAAVDALRGAAREAIETEITARHRELKLVALELADIAARIAALGALPGVSTFGFSAFDRPHVRVGGLDLLGDVSPDPKESERLGKAHGALFDTMAEAEALLARIGVEVAERHRLRMLESAQGSRGTR
jgi:hypothetical protein